ncbi:uncharacterized protein LOC5512003 isoform X2 [Nematostella vectensis]|uniref:uncharacterized protein LOC5512003 isoform X2 n=1 Tax=Nematostella vectensis TaxID=45351 RepID=UPI0020773685|nr:uncharacterized protein LOC5512003 isoform X2 [Nematostella vectensis]
MSTTTSTSSSLNPKCHEYCHGTPAVCYCPQCCAVFCESCYNLEHQGNERKRRHEKQSKLRPICTEHRHPLEFFDFTTSRALCVLCKKALQSESQVELIETIEEAVPKLRKLLQEKVASTESLLEDTGRVTVEVEKTAQEAVKIAYRQIDNVLAQCRNALEKREKQVKDKVQLCKDIFLNDEENTALKNNRSELSKAVKEAEGILHSDDARAMVVQYKETLSNLDNLTFKVSRGGLRAARDLKFTVKYCPAVLNRIQNLMIIEPTLNDFPEAEEGEIMYSGKDSRVRFVIGIKPPTDTRRPSNHDKETQNNREQENCEHVSSEQHEGGQGAPVSHSTSVKDAYDKQHVEDVRPAPTETRDLSEVEVIGTKPSRGCEQLNMTQDNKNKASEKPHNESLNAGHEESNDLKSSPLKRGGTTKRPAVGNTVRLPVRTSPETVPNPAGQGNVFSNIQKMLDKGDQAHRTVSTMATPVAGQRTQSGFRVTGSTTEVCARPFPTTTKAATPAIPSSVKGSPGRAMTTSFGRTPEFSQVRAPGNTLTLNAAASGCPQIVRVLLSSGPNGTGLAASSVSSVLTSSTGVPTLINRTPTGLRTVTNAAPTGLQTVTNAIPTGLRTASNNTQPSLRTVTEGFLNRQQTTKKSTFTLLRNKANESPEQTVTNGKQTGLRTTTKSTQIGIQTVAPSHTPLKSSVSAKNCNLPKQGPVTVSSKPAIALTTLAPQRTLSSLTGPLIKTTVSPAKTTLSNPSSPRHIEQFPSSFYTSAEDILDMLIHSSPKAPKGSKEASLLDQTFIEDAMPPVDDSPAVSPDTHHEVCRMASPDKTTRNSKSARAAGGDSTAVKNGKGTVQATVALMDCRHGNNQSREKKSPRTPKEKLKVSSTPTSQSGRKRGRQRTESDDVYKPPCVLRPRLQEASPEGCKRFRRGGELDREINCPEYYKQIANPMDLSIVKEKLHSYQYHSVVEFVRDMNLIFSNCKDFNKPGSTILEEGLRLEELFKQLLYDNFPGIEEVIQSEELMESSL